MADMIPGGWTSFNFDVSKEEKKIFEKVFEGFTGATYSPLAVATQVVEGMNYCFLCKGNIVVPSNPEFAAKVYVYAPLKGDAHITEIERVTP